MQQLQQTQDFNFQKLMTPNKMYFSCLYWLVLIVCSSLLRSWVPVIILYWNGSAALAAYWFHIKGIITSYEVCCSCPLDCKYSLWCYFGGISSFLEKKKEPRWTHLDHVKHNCSCYNFKLNIYYCKYFKIKFEFKLKENNSLENY